MFPENPLLAILTFLLGVTATLLLKNLLVIYGKHRDLAKIVNKIPAIPAWPILGNLLEVWVPTEDAYMAFLKMLGRFPNQPVVRFRMLHKQFVAIKECKAAEVILSNSENVNKSEEYEVTNSWLGLGLLKSERELWEKRRKMINPSFHSSILNGFMPIFNEQSRTLIKVLEKLAAKGEAFELSACMSHCSLDILCETTLGVKSNVQQVYDSEYVKATHDIGLIYMQRLFNPLLYFPFIFNLTRLRRREISCIKTLHGFTNKIIKERRQLLQSKTEDLKTEEVFGKKRRFATLDLLLTETCDGKKLTDKEIREEADINTAAGHETTAAGITWTLFLLGHHPDIQRKVQQEIDEVLGNDDRSITTSDLPNLKYVEAVIKESLRIFPPISVIGRKLTEAVVINGYTIPPGITVGISVWYIHRDPNVFPDPEKFDPDRFLGSNGMGRTAYEYMPFSAGPRNCIGQKYGMMELKVVLAHVLQHFNVFSHTKREDIKFVVTPELRSFHGLYVHLEKRV